MENSCIFYSAVTLDQIKVGLFNLSFLGDFNRHLMANGKYIQLDLLYSAFFRLVCLLSPVISVSQYSVLQLRRQSNLP